MLSNDVASKPTVIAADDDYFDGEQLFTICSEFGSQTHFVTKRGDTLISSLCMYFCVYQACCKNMRIFVCVKLVSKSFNLLLFHLGWFLWRTGCIKQCEVFLIVGCSVDFPNDIFHANFHFLFLVILLLQNFMMIGKVNVVSQISKYMSCKCKHFFL